jgi:nucleotide-binding universal stress UspA family protein
MLPALRTIVYATDLGHHAPQVFRYALSMARKYGARIHVVFAAEPLPPAARHMVELYAPADFSAGLEEKHWEEAAAVVRTRLEQFCREGQGTESPCADLIIEAQVVAGKPAEVILAEASRVAADLIVLGSHGHSTVGEILLGSTAHRVAQHSAVPVLLVPVREADTSDSL